MNKQILITLVFGALIGPAYATECGEDGQDYLALAGKALDSSNLERATDYVDKAQKNGCVDYAVSYRLGEELQASAEFAAALEAYKEAEGVAPNVDAQALAIGRYAQVQNDLGEADAALALVQEARRMHSAPPEWLETFAVQLDEQLAAQPFTRERVTRSFSTSSVGRLSVATITRRETTPVPASTPVPRPQPAPNPVSAPAGAPLPFRVLFELNSSEISEGGEKAVAELAEGLADPSLEALKFWLVGHTDARGDSAYNARLSRQRAESVYRAVTRLKPSLRGRIRVQGAGEDLLLYPDAVSELHHRLNRRVEVKIDSG